MKNYYSEKYGYDENYGYETSYYDFYVGGLVPEEVVRDREIKMKKFLDEKSLQNEEVAKFTENTKNRMRGSYGNYLKEAGLLEENNGKILYRKIYLDYELENLLRENKMEMYIKALKGEV